MSKNKKGFTLIELVVVIAIISILSAIVFVDATQYINKGKDAAAIEDTNRLLTDSLAFYASNIPHPNTYDGVLSDENYLSTTAAISKAGYSLSNGCNTRYCADSAIKWCASIELKQYIPAENYCVDSGGAKIKTTGAACVSGVCQR